MFFQDILYRFTSFAGVCTDAVKRHAGNYCSSFQRQSGVDISYTLSCSCRKYSYIYVSFDE
jgi:hypothetical protein